MNRMILCFVFLNRASGTDKQACSNNFEDNLAGKATDFMLFI